MGWTRIEKQVEIAKHRLGPLKDPAFAHPSTLTHHAHRHKTTADELHHLQGIGLHLNLLLCLDLERIQRLGTVHHQGGDVGRSGLPDQLE